MKTIYFVRHGECLANAQGRFAGSRNDSPLTELGRQQAGETGEALKAKGLAADLIVCSPRIRAKDTASRIADTIGYQGEIRIESILDERDFGAVTGELKPIAIAKIAAEQVEDLESLEDFAARQRRVLELLAILPGKHILVVGHGGAEQMLRTLYEGRPPHTFLQTESLPNATVREYTV